MTVAAQNIAAAYPKAAPIAEDIVQVALHVGAHPYDLANIIGFESGWTFSPSIVNSEGATGLIQFYPSHTRKNLGIETTDLAKMSASEQMDWVQKYLDDKRRGRPLDTVHKLFMAIFHAPAMKWDPNDRFSTRISAGNFGISTPAEYVQAVMKNAKLPSSEFAPPPSELVSPSKSSWSWSKPSWPTLPSMKSIIASFVPDEDSVWENKTRKNVVLKSNSTGETYGPGRIPPGFYTVFSTENNGAVISRNAVILPQKRYILSIRSGSWKLIET
jgi:hypothetical protein